MHGRSGRNPGTRFSDTATWTSHILIFILFGDFFNFFLDLWTILSNDPIVVILCIVFHTRYWCLTCSPSRSSDWIMMEGSELASSDIWDPVKVKWIINAISWLIKVLLCITICVSIQSTTHAMHGMWPYPKLMYSHTWRICLLTHSTRRFGRS